MVLPALVTGGCDYDNDVDTNLVIELQSSANRIEANGTDTTIISIRIPAASTTKTISVNTDVGTFFALGNPTEVKVVAEKEMDSVGSLLATVKLAAGTVPKTGFVVATVAEESEFVTIQLDTSFAEQIGLQSSLGIIDTVGKSATIAAFLSRTISGKRVSQGVPVRFRSFQVVGPSMNVDVGRFTNLGRGTTNENGQASVDFFADDGTVQTGVPVFITAITHSQTCELGIADTVAIQVPKPETSGSIPFLDGRKNQ